MKNNLKERFNQIILEQPQKELLTKIAEAARNVPYDRRQKFLVVQSSEGDFLVHSGLPDGEIQIYFGDIETLDRAGLLTLGFGSRGSPNFDILPLGFKYYEYLKGQLGEPIEQVDKTYRSLLVSQDFKNKYSKAFEKWSAAEELLWKTDTQKQLTIIGHLCRESVQEFAEALIEKHKPKNPPIEKTKTVDRLKAVVDQGQKELGPSKKSFLRALIEYWSEVNNLIQRQEHDSQKEGTELKWEDARRVVFQTIVVMFEINAALEIQ